MIEGKAIEDLIVSVKIYKEDIAMHQSNPDAMRAVVNAAVDWVQDAIVLALKAKGIRVAK